MEHGGLFVSIAVEAKNLVKDFGSVRALDGLNFKIEKGEITGPGQQVMLSGNLPSALKEFVGMDDKPVNVSGGLSPIACRLPHIAFDKIVIT